MLQASENDDYIGVQTYSRQRIGGSVGRKRACDHECSGLPAGPGT